MSKPESFAQFAQFQVLGSHLKPIMEGFGSFSLLASSYLIEAGVGTPDENMLIQFEPHRWYPLDRWLRVFNRIHAEFGDLILRQVGSYGPKYAVIPPQIVDVMTAVQFLDVGYHLNHGVNGEPMFNPQTGEMKDGIGHYRALPGAPGAKKVSCEVDSPYPCPFDEGLLTTITQKFQPKAVITHDRAGCRTRGNRSCTYHVTWD